MSRTDVHRPFRVIMLDPTVRRWFVDHHNHESGTCDLDRFLRTCEYTRPLGCYRGIGPSCPNLCGCQLCSDQFWRKHARRRERAAWRAVRQDLLKWAPRDREDMDVPPIHAEVPW